MLKAWVFVKNAVTYWAIFLKYQIVLIIFFIKKVPTDTINIQRMISGYESVSLLALGRTFSVSEKMVLCM